MAGKFQMQDKNMQGALRELARITGASYEDVVEHETYKALEIAVRRTPAAKASSIRKRRADRQWITLDGKRYRLGRKYNPALQARLDASMQRGLKRDLLSRGLLKKSWVQIGSELGVTIKAPGYVMSAKAENGDFSSNAGAKRISRGKGFYIECTNARPYGYSFRIKAIASAIRGRAKYFRTNLKKGVMDDASKIAKAYPGLIVRRA
jgi:hypothetical protein